MVMNILTEGKRFSTCTRLSTCKAPRSKMSLVVDLAVLHPTSKGEGVSCPSNDIQDDELLHAGGKTRVCIRHTGAATRFFFGILESSVAISSGVVEAGTDGGR